MMRKIGYFLVVLMLVSGFLAAAGAVEEVEGVTEDTILLGTFQAMTGPVASIGVPVAEGLEAYFQYVNKEGGINGRSVKLIIADDQFNPANTVVEVQRLVESDKVFAIIAGLGTPGVLAVMDSLNEDGVPFVYQASGSSKIAVPPKEFTFPVQPNYLVEGNIMTRYLVEEKGAKKIAIIYRNADDGKEEFGAVSAAIGQYGAELVAAVPVNPTSTDFSVEINKIADAEPDAIIVMLFNPQTPNFIKQAKQYGLTDPDYLMSYPNADATFVTLAGDASEGVEVMAWVDVDFTATEFLPFTIWQEFKGDKSLPNAFTLAGMAAAELFVEAAQRAGTNLTRATLVDSLEGFENWSGDIATGISYKPYSADDETCRLGKQSMYVLKVVNGVWTREADWVFYQ